MLPFQKVFSPLTSQYTHRAGVTKKTCSFKGNQVTLRLKKLKLNKIDFYNKNKNK